MEVQFRNLALSIGEIGFNIHGQPVVGLTPWPTSAKNLTTGENDVCFRKWQTGDKVILKDDDLKFVRVLTKSPAGTWATGVILWEDEYFYRLHTGADAGNSWANKTPRFSVRRLNPGEQVVIDDTGITFFKQEQDWSLEEILSATPFVFTTGIHKGKAGIKLGYNRVQYLSHPTLGTYGWDLIEDLTDCRVRSLRDGETITLRGGADLVKP
jgi:hypothetical protein